MRDRNDGTGNQRRVQKGLRSVSVPPGEAGPGGEWLGTLTRADGMGLSSPPLQQILQRKELAGRCRWGFCAALLRVASCVLA
jgi:hypothetical protein